MGNTIHFNYGGAQHLLSRKMASMPLLAKLLNKTLGYTNIGNYSRAKVFTQQIATLDLASMNKILDLGCGYGENAIMMAQSLSEKQIHALDIDANALTRVRSAKKALALNNLTIHQTKIDGLAENDFDFIYSVDVFEHIPESEMPFAEAYSKLKDGGFLLVKIPNRIQSTIFDERYFSEHNQWVADEHPGQIYFLEDLATRFEKSGFRVVLKMQTDGPLARLAWEIAYFTKRWGSLFQLIALPLCKLLVNLDILIYPKGTAKGNAITVVGQK